MASCSGCTPDRWGRHQPGCDRGQAPPPKKKRRSRAKGATKSPPGTVLIASHTSNWHLVAEGFKDGLWYSAWNCTVCSRPKNWRSNKQNDRPGNEWHEKTVAK